jgi:hypothetical protein
MTTQTPETTTTTRSSLRSTWRPLARHFLEMLAAMFVGMFVLGSARSMLGPSVQLEDRPGAWYALMAIDMSVGMAAWMRYRGHAWPGTLEMCAAMFVPIALVPLVWAGAMGAMTFMTLAHVVMIVAMLAVLLRRRQEFAHC